MINKPQKPKRDIYIKLIRFKFKPIMPTNFFPKSMLMDQEIMPKRQLIFRKVLLEDDVYYYFRNKNTIDSVRRNSVESFSV